MISILFTSLTPFKPIQNHYYKYAGKHYGTPSVKLYDTSLNIGKVSDGTRHPYNIITAEMYD